VAYEVEITARASRELLRIERGDRTSARRIDVAITSLGDDPRPASATKMIDMDGWRLRVGVYRVLYTIEDAVRIVTVTRVGHRKQVYER
jgi:mRNA interferase RelE/StbE